MAYQTGTAADFVALLGAINTFATANGWTANMWAVDTGANWRLHLSKGSQYVNFLAVPSDSLKVIGSDGYNGASAWNAQPVSHAESCALVSGASNVWHPDVVWPITYYLFAHSSPDSVEVVIQTSPGVFQWLMFGALTKFGTWTGGAYVAASWSAAAIAGADTSNQYPGNAAAFAGQNIDISNDTFLRPLAPLFGHVGGNYTGSAYQAAYGTHLRAALDSLTWANARNYSSATPSVIADVHVYPLVGRSVSQFNGLTTLQPIWPMLRRPDNHWSILGRVEHVRYANVINHLPGQVIDLGADRWMLFPQMQKGGITDPSPSVLHAGFAVRYDGP